MMIALDARRDAVADREAGGTPSRLDIADPDLCLRLFKSNRDAGLILFAALVGDALYQAYTL